MVIALLSPLLYPPPFLPPPFLQSAKQKWQKRYHMLIQQELLLGELKAIMATISGLKEDRPKRVRQEDRKSKSRHSSSLLQIEKLRSILSSRGNLLSFQRATRLPLDPNVLVRSTCILHYWVTRMWADCLSLLSLTAISLSLYFAPFSPSPCSSGGRD